SISGQQDDRVTIAVDTLVVRQGQADAARLRIRILTSQASLMPTVSSASVLLSKHPSLSPQLTTGSPSLWGQALPIPACSQMVYPDGGEIWCSPTSVTMVLGYWTERTGIPVGACEPRVRDAVAGVYDYAYNGHGNWPFNTAYAATKGLEGYVTRLSGLDEAERWIARGIPLVVSFGWAPGQLDGAPLPSSSGHLAVLAGFDPTGNPVVYDPAAINDASVRRTYRRDQFEQLWLSRTAGTAYIIAPTTTFDLPPRLYVPVMRNAP
ncbi:MAG: peptidase C39 family protein, partial [Ardenticatenales bacterium]|nr:peptidase C39 family protein [Ardenticatenales bacterium]